MKRIFFLQLILFLVVFNANASAITARSFLVTDAAGSVLVEKNADRSQPIASITKLMTVIVVLNARQSLEESVPLNFKLSRQYHTRLPRSLKTLSRRELIQLAMVKSDNFAAYTLCDNYPGGVEFCVAAMNQEAQRLGMSNTHFEDPTGLDAGNISNARDLSKLVLAANYYDEIVNASGKSKVSIPTRKSHTDFPNTNPIVRTGNENVLVSKTGFIGASGGCIVMLIDTVQGPRVVVLLGSRNTRTRIPEARSIIASL
jgi:serine-type D-Ala-D-Ala endopeptidase (penicillin-binding protein 7)